MMLKNLCALILLIIAISACSKQPDCMIADSLQEIENKSLNDKRLHLYLRTSGFSEKEHFYELFKGAPSFDECGATTADTLSQAHVDTSLGSPKKLIIKSNQIQIEYSSDEAGHQFSSVIIVVE